MQRLLSNDFLPPSLDLNKRGDCDMTINAPDITDLSSPLLLRSESDEGVKDWFESNGCIDEEPLIDKALPNNVEERFLILLISSLIMLQTGFLIGSYFFPWFGIKVETSLMSGDQLKNVHRVMTTSYPFGENLSLTQFLSLIKYNWLYYNLIFSTAYIIPPISVFMNTFITIISMRFIGLRSNRNSLFVECKRRSRWHHFMKHDTRGKLFNVIHLFSKFQLVVVYMCILFLVAISTIQISAGKQSTFLSTSTEYFTTNKVVHEIRGGMVSFVFAAISGSLALFLIQVLLQRVVEHSCQPESLDKQTSLLNALSSGTNFSGFRSPPAAAFKRIPWNDALLQYEDDDNNKNAVMNDPSVLGLDSIDLSRLNPESNTNYMDETHMEDKRDLDEQESLSPLLGLSEILRFEICVLAVILWIPIFTLPIFQVQVQGFLSFLIESSSTRIFSFNLWHIFSVLINGGIFNVFIVLFFFHQIIFCPVLLLSFHTVSWYREEMGKKLSSGRIWVQFCFPFVSTLPFVLGTALVVHNIGSMSHSVINQSHICVRLMNLINDENGTCLLLQAQERAGLWLFLTEGLCLEIIHFVM